MNRFTYTRGVWSDGNTLPDWEDEEDFLAFVDRTGFSTIKTQYGHDHLGSLEIYESKHGETFLANVSPTGNNCYEVLLPDFPSLMMFLREFSATFSTQQMEYLQSEVHGLLERFFRASHGHDPSAVCRQCDPREYEASAKAKAQLA